MVGSTFTQYYATICANCIMFSYGISLGWVSPVLEVYQAEDSPLPSGPLNINELAIITSISCVGGIITSICSGWIADKIGRKLTMIIFNFSFVFGWLLVMYAQNGYYLIASKILHGLGGGVGYIVVPIFVTEISEDRVRGRLGALLLLSCNLGILYGFVIGACLDYFITSICHLIIPILFFIGIGFVKESPVYLMQNGRSKQAEESLRFYRGYKKDARDSITKERLALEFEKLSSLIKSSNVDSASKITFKDFCTKAAIKSMVIGFALMTFEIFTGSYTLLSYASLIFADAGSTLSPNVSTIVIGVVEVVGVYISVILVDRTGRKFLLIISAVFCTLGLGLFVIYDYMKVELNIDVSDYNWIPLVSFSIVITFANFGLISLPFLVMAEITPMKIKSIVFSMALAYSWILALITMVYMPAGIIHLGLYGTLSIFMIGCLMAVIFIAIFVPETKNRSMEEIQEIMSK